VRGNLLGYSDESRELRWLYWDGRSGLHGDGRRGSMRQGSLLEGLKGGEKVWGWKTALRMA